MSRRAPNPASLLDELFAQSDDYVLVVDERFTLVQASESWRRRMPDHISIEETLEADAIPKARHALARARNTARTVELDHVDRDGHGLRVAWQLVPCAALGVRLMIGREAADETRRLVQILRLQHERRRLSGQLHRQAGTDLVTGVSNRRALLTAARWTWSHVPAATVVTVDIDAFRKVNDVLGHDEADQVLLRVAEALTAAAGVDAIVGRWAGDQFTVVCEREEADIGGRLLAAVRGVGVGAESVGLTASIGVSVVPDTALIPLADAIAAADASLEEARMQGRDRSVGRHLRPRLCLTTLPPDQERRAPSRWRLRHA